MQITAKSDYALRAMCVLAVAEEGVVVKAADIAAAQDIPPNFLDAILVQLRRGGMVVSRRGPGGGHQLARPAWAITLADVVRVIDGPLTLIHGERPEAMSHPAPATHLQDVWVAVRAALRGIMEETTLRQVVTGDLPAPVTALGTDHRSWTSVWPPPETDLPEQQPEA
ncbi:Rrf2 family transcriptional regulator [Rhodococcus sp. X156]|uniref:RrF2 family transcriptional regulator n=1 Tax=Rhodococcus sp. X156 TaxID=2499145 RepID=UPI000FDBBC5E|nr:Rrf2 family transcriptional regulator [Rhodococcus sp. X156]